MRAIGQRILHLIAVLFLVSVATMMLVDLVPGDPALEFLGPEATDEQVAAIHRELGLDKSLPSRYVEWVGDAVRGDLGQSFRTKLPVADEIQTRVPVNLELAVLSLLLALLIAIPLGAYAAHVREGRFDRAASGITSIMLSSPPFLTATVLVFVLSVKLKWLPVAGWTSMSEDLGENLRHIALPVFAMAMLELAQFSRLLRSDMVDTLDQDYILAARSVGLPRRQILFRYAFRPSSISLVTIAAITLGRLIGGTVIMEQIFALPGLGTLVVRSITGKDIIVVQGVVLFVGTVYVVLNMLSNVLYAWLDPRIRTLERRG
jgi:peptide/nickel transport system permease protein